MNYLDTAARLYRYPFRDALLIHAQRPDAFACAELDVWNQSMNRWVNRGARGIALIDERGDQPRLRYVFNVWEETKKDRLTQLVFCDLSTPKADGSFNVYDDIRNKLVAMGIPKEEVAFIHETNTEARKAELFAKVRSGQVRVLLGSTPKLGAGTNVQDKLIALHHLDCPWKPSDLEQQEGRILRQGKPFEKEAELAEKLERLSELNALLNLDEHGSMDAVGIDEVTAESVEEERKAVLEGKVLPDAREDEMGRKEEKAGGRQGLAPTHSLARVRVNAFLFSIFSCVFFGLPIQHARSPALVLVTSCRFITLTVPSSL